MTSRLEHDVIELFPPSFAPWRGGGDDRDIAVLVSGGVDSSTAASLLKESGWNVLGITMKIPVAAGCERTRPCCGAEAALVCAKLGIGHYFLGVEDVFRKYVIEPFEAAYVAGRTPNPCVDCNTFLKFRVVWDFIEKTFGIRRLATGHYARIVDDSGEPRLGTAVDVDRDQSYFLYGIRRGRLGDLVFPLGDMTKQAVRELARKQGLGAAERIDSMELCFAASGDYRRALSGQLGAAKGPILDMAGNVLGEHNGIFNYTLGQRRGSGVAAGKPLYVTAISPKENSITLGPRDAVLRRDVRAEDLNTLIPERIRIGERLLGKIRSYGDGAPCTINEVGNNTIAVEFDDPQFAPCPGQRLVLYDERGFVAAGGAISL